MIKVLWIVNTIFPEVNEYLNNNKSFKTSGGWLIASADELMSSGGIELSIINVSPRVKRLSFVKGDKIHYYVLPFHKNYKDYYSDMKEVNRLSTPDIVHIHGTEMPFGRAWIDACPINNVVVSIQGLISVISQYYFAGLSYWEILSNITLRDILRTTILGERKDFIKRGEIEKDVLKRVKHIVGRTSFDHAHCLAINPDLNYHFCNESLRREIYGGVWRYDKCKPHSIFLSQASYPIKGLHLVLKALPLIKRHFPDVTIRVAGGDITRMDSLEWKLRQSGYGKIIRELIKKNKLEDTIIFTGPLDSAQMKNEYLNANLFICPSSIENSSNSVCEAQILGVPTLASYVGGLPDLIPNEDCGILYRYDDIEMLAFKVCQLFDKSPQFDNSEMIDLAKKRHNVEANNRQLISIYRTVLESKK